MTRLLTDEEFLGAPDEKLLSDEEFLGTPPAPAITPAEAGKRATEAFEISVEDRVPLRSGAQIEALHRDSASLTDELAIRKHEKQFMLAPGSGYPLHVEDKRAILSSGEDIRKWSVEQIQKRQEELQGRVEGLRRQGAAELPEPEAAQPHGVTYSDLQDMVTGTEANPRIPDAVKEQVRDLLTPAVAPEAWERAGEIGVAEKLARKDWAVWLPVAGIAFDVAHMRRTKEAAERLQEEEREPGFYKELEDREMTGVLRAALGGGPLRTADARQAADEAIVTRFLLDVAETDARGVTWPAVIAEGITNLLPYMIEFALTAGVATMVKGAVQTGSKVALRKLGVHLAGRFAKRIAASKGAAVAARLTNMAARAAVGGAVRAPMWGAAEIEQRQIPVMELGRRGKIVFQRDGETPARAVLHGLLSGWIEATTEEMGQEIFGPLGRAAAEKLAVKVPLVGKLLSHLDDLRGKVPRLAALSKSAGYSDLISEMGEEQAGRTIRAVLGLEPPGSMDEAKGMLERLAASVPSVGELLTEGAILAAPALLRLGAGVAARREGPPAAEAGRGVEAAPKGAPPAGVQPAPPAPAPGSRADLVARVEAMRKAGEEVTPESVAERLAVGRDVAETLIAEVAPAEKPAPGVGVEPKVAPPAPARALPEKPAPFAAAPESRTVLGDLNADETGAFEAKSAEEVVRATETALGRTYNQAKGLWRGLVDLPGEILKAIPAENPIGKLRDWIGPRISVAFGRPQEWVEEYFRAQGSALLAKLRVAKIAADMTAAFKKAGLDPNTPETLLRIEQAVRGEIPMESLPPIGQEWAKTIRAAQDTESLYAAEIFDQVGMPEKATTYRENVGKYLKHVPLEQVSLTARARAFIGRLVGPRLSRAWGKRARTRWDVYVGQKIVASFDPATDPQAEVKARAAYQNAVEDAKVDLATKQWQAKTWKLTRKGKVPVTKTVMVDGKPVRKFTGEFLAWMKTVEGAGPEAADLYRKAAGRVRLVEPISAQWRLEHEVHDPRYLLARGAIEARHDAEMARLFQVAAERWGQEAPTDMTEEEVAEWAKDGGLVQLPESGRLHGLKGMYVPKNIALDLTDMVRAPGMLSKLYQQYLGVWKESKTVWNPATHGRNVIGNVAVFSYLARCSPLNPLNAKFYVQATQELWKKGKAYEDLVRLGAVGTEYYGAELHRLNDIVRVQGTSRLDTLMSLQRACRDNMGALYALEDQWFKTAAFLKYRSEGMSAQEAAVEVNRWFPNYARVGKLTRILRQSPIGAPFLSFVDQSIRIGGRAVRDRPIRLLALAAAPGILSYLSALSLGLSDEEKEFVDKRRGYFEPLMPFRGNRGQVMNLDLRYIMPLANDILPEYRNDLLNMPWFMQSPMLRAGIEQMINKDLFLGRPLVTDKMTAAERVKARAKQFAITAAPYPTGAVYGPGRIGRAMDKDGRETLGLVILGTLSGVNIRPAYVSENDVRELVKNAWLEGEPELAETFLRLWNDRYRSADRDRLMLSSIAAGAVSGWSSARTTALREAAASLLRGQEEDAQERLDVFNETVLPEVHKRVPGAKSLNIEDARRLAPSTEKRRAYYTVPETKK